MFTSKLTTKDALDYTLDKKKTQQNEIRKLQNTYVNGVSKFKLMNFPVIIDNLKKKSVTINNNIKKPHLKNIKIIHNVYQEFYMENKKPTGFGDFIRGCYFLLQFCDNYGIQPNIIIRHPIALFLKKFSQNYNNNNKILDNIPFFFENNFLNTQLDSNNYIIHYVNDNYKCINKFITYLSELTISNDELFTYNIMFPYNKNIINEHKLYIRNVLEPTEEMNKYIYNTLSSINLLKNTYSVIHLRCGDDYLVKNMYIITKMYFKKIINEISIIINNNSTSNFLLISDNNRIKYFIIQQFPNIKTLFNNITHIGEGLLDEDKIKNTLLEFYLLSYSNSIFSFTCYPHGTGFSYWCAQTYDIPYKCKYISSS
jgi:hypothetical protein